MDFEFPILEDFGPMKENKPSCKVGDYSPFSFPFLILLSSVPPFPSKLKQGLKQAWSHFCIYNFFVLSLYVILKES
jgi:hypothetical protein